MNHGSKPGTRHPRISNRSSRLGNVMTDLKDRSDIGGAVLINREGRVLAGAMSHETISNSGLSELLPELTDISCDHAPSGQGFMFPTIITEHRGHRILARSVREDLYLLVLLHDSCYMGLTMLDMENSIMRIRDILRPRPP